MNTKIARRLNEVCRENDPTRAKIIAVGKSVVESHNSAVKNGFLELPMLEFIDIDGDSVVGFVDFMVAPVSGMTTIDDLYNIKSVWGADKMCVGTEANKMAIILEFSKK